MLVLGSSFFFLGSSIATRVLPRREETSRVVQERGAQRKQAECYQENKPMLQECYQENSKCFLFRASFCFLDNILLLHIFDEILLFLLS